MPTLRLVLPQALFTTGRHDSLCQLGVIHSHKVWYHTKEDDENRSQEVAKDPSSKPSKIVVRKIVSTNDVRERSRLQLHLLGDIAQGESKKPEQPIKKREIARALKSESTTTIARKAISEKDIRKRRSINTDDRGKIETARNLSSEPIKFKVRRILAQTHASKGKLQPNSLKDETPGDVKEPEQARSRDDRGKTETARDLSSESTTAIARTVVSEKDVRERRSELHSLKDIALGDIKKSEQLRSRDDGGKSVFRNREIADKARTSATKPSLLEELFPEEVKKPKQSRITKLSLLEELFPEEAKKPEVWQSQSTDKEDELPPLPPPNFLELQVHHEQDTAKKLKLEYLKAREASLCAFRQENPTVLVLSSASVSLSESDFSRVAPRGMHIEEWRGPGDVLKVIPNRDPVTLEPRSTYWLVFPNPAHARTYQNHIIHLHKLASAHTPISIESPMAPPPGMLINGEDVNALLQDYTLCPPSQRLSLVLLRHPYHHSTLNVLAQNGYSQIVQPENKSGRSVLFWVDGHQPTTAAVRQMLARNGSDRGTPWGPLNGKGSIEPLQKPTEPLQEDPEHGQAREEHLPRSNNKAAFRRWVIAFEHESEARRFVRVWSGQPYPFPVASENSTQGEPAALVHAEFLW